MGVFLNTVYCIGLIKFLISTFCVVIVKTINKQGNNIVTGFVQLVGNASDL